MANKGDGFSVSKYKKEYCKLLIKHMETGYSFETFGAGIEVAPSTLYNWVDAHPEFKEAKKIAFAKCQMFWEKMGMEGIFMGGKDNPFQAGMWNFNMGARFRWSNKVEQKIDQTVTLEALVDSSFEGEKGENQ